MHRWNSGAHTCGTRPEVETVILEGEIWRPGWAVSMSNAGSTAGRLLSGSPMPMNTMLPGGAASWDVWASRLATRNCSTI
eukprot:scaffold37113_cov20-Prasinocladus_malaysianus.AAC.1